MLVHFQALLTGVATDELDRRIGQAVSRQPSKHLAPKQVRVNVLGDAGDFGKARLKFAVLASWFPGRVRFYKQERRAGLRKPSSKQWRNAARHITTSIRSTSGPATNRAGKLNPPETR